jgi:serine/threonine-protein kinase
MSEAVQKTDAKREPSETAVSDKAKLADRRDSAPPPDGPPEGPDPLIGTVIASKFEILDLLGKGAMGRIYRARHLDLDRTIAIKVLHEHLGGEDRVAKRFHREAKAASRLSHPNSVHIIDFGRTKEGLLYIAMELLEGEDLQTILDHDHPLAPERIAHILVPALRAVEEAHRAGVIHRDFKPDNIIVWEDRGGREHVKVCDFGIAKVLDSVEGSSITVDGFVCGTPQYMAPEQARGDDIDHRVDVYAAGVVLYQMLVGKPPFGGDTALGIITKHLTDTAVPPHERVPELGVPRALEEIATKAMKKDPAERQQTAAEIADAIESAVKALGDDAKSRLGEGPFTRERTKREWAAGDTTAKTAIAASIPPPASTTGRNVAIGVGVVVLVLVGWWMTRAPAAPPTTVAPLPTTVVQVAPPPTTVIEVEHVEAPEPPPSTITPPVSLAPEPTTLPPTTHIRPPRTTTVEPPPTTTVADSRSDGQRAFDEGRRLFLANDVPGAITQFESAARLMPNDAEVQKQLGRAYMRAGSVPQSITAYRRYLALRPDAPDRAIVEGIIAQH